MLDPFSNSSSDYFGQSRFSDTSAQNADMAAQFVGGIMQNRGYVTAAKRADAYRRRAAQAAQGSQPSTGSQIGGAIASAGAGAAVTGIIGLI
jgi:hypothetical protein